MKRKWETDELVEHWSLNDSEMELVRRKKGVNRLGMAFLLKFFQHEGRFPSQKNEIFPDILLQPGFEQLISKMNQFICPAVREMNRQPLFFSA
jgi:Domain of unknown function (DUF4158)